MVTQRPQLQDSITSDKVIYNSIAERNHATEPVRSSRRGPQSITISYVIVAVALICLGLYLACIAAPAAATLAGTLFLATVGCLLMSSTIVASIYSYSIGAI